MDTYNNIILFFLIINTGLVTYKNTHETIDTYDISSILVHSITYLIIGTVKRVTLTNGIFMDDILLTTSSIMMVSLIHKVVMALVYPKADRNKDGFLTTKEFYEWKHKLETRVVGD